MANNFYSDPLTGKALPERRSGVDRRSSSGFFSVFSAPFRRRKSKGRRKTDPSSYIDVYDTRSWTIAIAILALSAFDALVTGLHMVRGSAREANPIMSAVIDIGGLPAFFGVKGAMTIIPVAIILIHKEWALARLAARLCLWAYLLLAVYHTFLIYASKLINT